jgi:small subunit ribosomal protein S17
LDAIAAQKARPTMLALRRAALLRPQVRCLATTPTTQKRWGPPAPPTTTNLPRGCLVGAVVSTAMAKTVNVDVTRTKIVPKYRKARRYSRRFLAHDENQECSLGDVVRIAPCRPLSRRKHFVVQEILKKN